MKKLIFFMSILTCMASCSEEKQLVSATPDKSGYSEFLKSNPNFAKTSKLSLENAQYELEYVRDQKYYNDTDFCYGHLVTDASSFRDILDSFTTDYDANDVWEIKLLSEGPDLCNEEEIIRDNVKFLLVYYKNGSGISTLDYVDLSTNVKETYTIGDVRASVATYFLMKKSGITSYPAIISVRDGDFNYPSITWDDDNDYVARIAGPVQPMNPGLQDPSVSCPLNCVDGNEDDCVNFTSTVCSYTFDGPGEDEPCICCVTSSTKTLYANDEALSNNLFGNYSTLYSFRDDFLTKTTKGRRYLIDYYTLGQLIKEGRANNMSLSQMAQLANFIIGDADKLIKLINHNNNPNVVLYTASEANTYKSFLVSLKSLSNDAKWNSILNGVLSDLDANQGKTVSKIVLDMN